MRKMNESLLVICRVWPGSSQPCALGCLSVDYNAHGWPFDWQLLGRWIGQTVTPYQS